MVILGCWSQECSSHGRCKELLKTWVGGMKQFVYTAEQADDITMLAVRKKLRLVWIVVATTLKTDSILRKE